MADFGYSSTDLSIQEGRRPGFTFRFRALECFDPNLREWTGQKTRDVYSYSLVVFQIATEGDLPFEGMDEDEIDKAKRTGTDLDYLLAHLPMTRHKRFAR